MDRLDLAQALLDASISDAKPESSKTAQAEAQAAIDQAHTARAMLEVERAKLEELISIAHSLNDIAQEGRLTKLSRALVEAQKTGSIS